MYQFFTRRNINIGLAIFLAFLLVFGWFTFVNIRKARRESHIVNNTLQSLRAFEEIMDDMQDIESGQRGYLISGNRQFLQPFLEGIAHLAEDTIVLRDLAKAYPDRKEAIDELVKLSVEKASYAQTTVELLNDNNRDSLYQQIRSGKGRELMDSIRHIIQGFEDKDRDLLRSSNDKRETAAVRTGRLFVVAALLFITTCLLLFWRIKKELRLKEINEQELSHLASLIAQTSDAVFSSDNNIVIKTWNKAAEKMYGYKPEEAIGKRVGELLNVRDGVADNANTLAELRQKGHYEGEYTTSRKSGETVYIHASLSVLKNKKNEVEGYVAVHRDVTEKVKADRLMAKFNEELNRLVQEKTEEIKHSNERFEMITRTTNDAIWEWDLITGDMWANETHQQLYGLRPTDKVPTEREWAARMHAEDRHATMNSLYEALASERNVWIAEYRFLTGNNEYRYIYDRSYIVRSKEGKPLRILGAMMDVTDAKRAATALQQSEEKYRTMIEQASDGIFILDGEGRYIDANPAGCQLTGFSREELLKLSFADVLPKGELFITKLKGDELRSGMTIVMERTWTRSDGVTTSAEVSYKQLSNGYILAIARDITEKKRAEEALVKSEETRRLIMNSALDAIICIDAEGAITVWSRQAEKIFGWKEAEALGKNLTETIIPERYRENHLRGIAHYFKTGEGPVLNRMIEISAVNKDHQEFPVELSIIPIRQGRSEMFCAFIRDITERKKAQELIAREKELSDTAINSLPGIFYMFDSNRKILRWNKNFETVSGYTPAEIKDVLPVQFFAEEDRVLAQQKVAQTFRDGSAELEAHFLTKEGEKIPYFFTGLSVMYDGKLCMVGTGIDITERKKAEAELKRSNNRFEMITRTTNDAVWEWELESGQLWSNETHQQLYGLTMNDPVPSEGMWAARIHPDDRDHILKMQAEALASDTNVFISEYRFLSGDNNYVSLYDRCYIVRDDNGQPIRMMGSMMDISEMKKAENAVRISEARYRALVENAPEALVVLDMEQGKFVNVSESALRLFKMSREELLELGPLDVSPAIQPDGRPSPEAAMERINRAIQGEKPVFEWTHRDSEGKEIPCEVRLARLPSNTGVLIRGSIIDISERKQIEMERSNERNLLRALIDNLPDYIYIKDTKLNYIISNRALVKLVGAEDEAETTGKKSAELFGPEIGRINTDEDTRILETGKEVIDRDEPIVTREGKKLWLLTTKVPLKDAEGNVTGILGISKDITERKMAEEEIVKTNARFQTVSKATSDIVWDWDLATDEMWWNDNYYSNLGHRKQKEVENIEEWFKRIHPDDAERVRNKINKAIAGNGSTWQDAYRYIKYDGTYLHFLDRGFILRDSEGVAYKMIGSMVDMTPVYEAQRKISESEEKYRTLVEQAVDAIALYDAQGRILDVNTGSVQLLQYEKEELMKMQLSDILPQDELKAKPVRYDVLQQGESTVKQRSMRRKDGTVIQAEVRSQQLPDGRFLSVIRDLTERIKAQEQIEKQKELSDKLIDSLPGVFYWYDENGRFLRWNRQFEIVTGYSGKEIAGMHPTEFFEGEGRKHITERIQQVFEQGYGDAEAEFVAKDGSKTLYYFKAIRVIIDGRPCLLGTGIDISDRKRAEQELENSYDAVRKLTEYLQNVREEERTHIAREIHDELGQQLTVLKMDVSWLNKKINPTEDHIKQKMQDLLHMLDETVRTVRRISSELRPSLLDDLGLTAALEWQLKEFEKRSGIKTKFDAPEEEMELSNPVKTALFRIFQESLTNVGRHSGAKKLSVSLGSRDGNFVLTIIDDGKGFDKQKLAEKKTLGILGMRERTSMIGGNYTITSRPGRGTTVEVSVSLDDVNAIDQLNRN